MFLSLFEEKIAFRQLEDILALWNSEYFLVYPKRLNKVVTELAPTDQIYPATCFVVIKILT